MTRRDLTLDQCLFGYEDGHRLLASSMPLGEEASTLTSLSDLAPGAVFGGSEGYWTGVPAPGIGRYALMRTWPAPEMPRPGCVWTHALLLAPDDLGMIDDLGQLRKSVSRPAGTADRGRYSECITVGSGPWAIASDLATLGQAVLVDLLLALYADSGPAVPLAEPGGLDDPLFAVWSQQWPRLRRNLRFQTAAIRGPRPSSAPRFDVTAQLGLRDREQARPTEASAAWASEAAEDARRGARAPLRGFLRRYGGDVRRQRGSFRPLVEVLLLDEAGAGRAVGPELLSIVTRSFPELDDAARLKQDLIDGALLPAAQLDLLWFVLAGGGAKVFPAPTEEGIARLALLWPERPNDLLHLAEAAARSASELAVSIFEVVTGALPIESFWELTAQYPAIRRRMLEVRPSLMAAQGTLSLDNATLADLLADLAPDESVAERLVPGLVARDDDRLARVALDCYPVAVATAVVQAADGGAAVGRAWLRALVDRPDILLKSSVMGLVTRTSLLYDLAEALGWLSSPVVAAGTEPWIAGLVDVSSDLPDEKRDTFRAFMVAIALAAGGDGGRRVLEKFFGAVHHEVLRSRLPWRGRDILSPLLPDLGWARWWDFGLRLRLAAAAAYVREGYPPESFAGLVSGRKARTMLAEAAAEVPGGRPYARAARA